MAQLLEDVLTIGKSDAGKLKVMPEEIRLDELCRTTFEELETIDSKRHKFDLTTDKQPFLIRSDEMMIKQILNNLISNAMKYSPANSKICIDLSEHENKFEMKISDNGIGIPEDDRNKLFETFHRGSNTGTIKGTGLGLAIVQRCVSSLRGSIEFDSELYKGTTFSVRLPMHLE
jgi:signal transduction histidine kinase